MLLFIRNIVYSDEINKKRKHNNHKFFSAWFLFNNLWNENTCLIFFNFYVNNKIYATLGWNTA
jgi:hypothetical protein